MDKGYNIDHDVTSGKLITLFSAPDYPQFQATENRYGNKGAYIVLKLPNFDKPAFHCSEAVLPRPKVDAYYDYVNEVDSDKELDLSSVMDTTAAEAQNDNEEETEPEELRRSARSKEPNKQLKKFVWKYHG